MMSSYQGMMPGYQMLQTVRGLVHPWASDFLVLGFANNQPYFLEIASDGQLNWHTDSRFYAVGSGGEFAMVAEGLMAHYVEGGDLTLEMGIQVAARTIETTCRVSSAHVGLPVQLAVADSSGARVLAPTEVDEVIQKVEGWLELERNTLRTTVEPAEDLEEPPEFVEEETESPG